MSNVWFIAKRELLAYLRTPMGYLIAAGLLLLDGLAFNVFGVGSSPKLSSQVLQDYLYFAFGLTSAAAILVSMRLIAEERQTGTITLLFTSPVREHEIVIGKFVSALVFVTVMNLLTAYVPLLIFVNGKISVGHIAAGYLGLTLQAASVVAIGVLGSALSWNQLMAVVVTSLSVALLVLLWMVARVTDPPLSRIISQLALFQGHFQAFQRGILRVSDLVFYASLIFFALLAATRVLQSQRWR